MITGLADALLKAIMSFVIGLINLTMAPIDQAITQYLPVATDVITHFNDFITWVLQFIGWCMSWLNIPYFLIYFACMLIFADVAIRLFMTPIKLGLKWWHVIVP